WIEASANWTGTSGGEAFGEVGSIPYPSPNYVGSQGYLNIGAVVFCNADSAANRMRDSYYVHNVGAAAGGIFFYNSMNDTYTISGPAGTEGTAVTARLVFHGTGLLFVGTGGTLSSNRYYGYSRMELE